MKILKDLIYDVYYVKENKTVYIYPPVKVRDLIQIKQMLKYYSLDIENIVVGRMYENYG